MGWEVAQKLVDGLPRGHTVVSDQGKGDHEDLAAIRGIGDGLGIPDHASLED